MAFFLANVRVITAGYYTYGAMLVLIVLFVRQNVKSERQNTRTSGVISRSLVHFSTRRIETIVMSGENFALHLYATECPVNRFFNSVFAVAWR